MANNWRKWTPAVVAVVVVAGVAIAVPVAASASVHLPGKTPAQVIELIESSKVSAFSGDITETSDLGLPSLSVSGAPSGEGSGSSASSIASDLALITGSNSLRVYVDGPTNIRLQDLQSLGEQDVIRHGDDVWTYDSKSNAVEHATISAADMKKRAGTRGPSAQKQNDRVAPTTPEAIANDLLAKLKPTSTVTVGDDVSVAGRDAYDLVLTPKATDTLVGSVSIAVDAATGLPLQVQIDAAGQTTPAISIGFTSLNLSTPSASLFDFTPPSGATVKQLTGKSDGARSHAKPKAKSDAAKPTVSGKGWDAVVTVPAASTSSTSNGSTSSLSKLSTSPEFAELTEAVTGGRVLHTTLFNVLFTTDGRIVAGAVSVARLEAVAAQ